MSNAKVSTNKYQESRSLSCVFAYRRPLLRVSDMQGKNPKADLDDLLSAGLSGGKK